VSRGRQLPWEAPEPPHSAPRQEVLLLAGVVSLSWPCSGCGAFDRELGALSSCCIHHRDVAEVRNCPLTQISHRTRQLFLAILTDARAADLVRRQWLGIPLLTPRRRGICRRVTAQLAEDPPDVPLAALRLTDAGASIARNGSPAV
jgi:hypothetical protein